MDLKHANQLLEDQGSAFISRLEALIRSLYLKAVEQHGQLEKLASTPAEHVRKYSFPGAFNSHFKLPADPTERARQILGLDAKNLVSRVFWTAAMLEKIFGKTSDVTEHTSDRWGELFYPQMYLKQTDPESTMRVMQLFMQIEHLIGLGRVYDPFEMQLGINEKQSPYDSNGGHKMNVWKYAARLYLISKIEAFSEPQSSLRSRYITLLHNHLEKLEGNCFLRVLFANTLINYASNDSLGIDMLRSSAWRKKPSLFARLSLGQFDNKSINWEQLEAQFPGAHAALPKMNFSYRKPW
ncbi:MAG: hypothetical protein ACPGO5_04245 [Patescibacteria group bacterium]